MAAAHAFDQPSPAPSASGTSLYRLDVERLQELRPDLIITQDLCSVCSIDLPAVRAAAARMSPRPEVLSLNPHSFEGVLDDILTIGRAMGLERRAEDVLAALRERFYRAADFVNAFTAPTRVLFLEWTDPPFVAGHWTPQLIERAGGDPLLNPTAPLHGAGSGAGAQMAHRAAGPSRRVSIEELRSIDPQTIIIAPCGVALADAPPHVEALREQEWWRQMTSERSRRIALVDGNQIFSRPGPRLVEGYEFLVGWLNDRAELIPEGFPWRAM
jgi:ABC-type Fe3+-hydroxamate transport system substrate-binding protein